MRNESVDAQEVNRKARREAIAAYAKEMAGTDLDLDPDLESAGIEYLAKTIDTVLSF
jgi:hypothetical protein